MVWLTERIAEAEAAGAAPWVAFEFFPPRTTEGVTNLYKRFERMSEQGACVVTRRGTRRRRRAARCRCILRRGAGGSSMHSALRRRCTARRASFLTAARPHLRSRPLPASGPLYADITWGAGGSTSALTLEIAVAMKKAGLEPNMHLTCTHMESSKITEALEGAKAAGISNICALRGGAHAAAAGGGARSGLVGRVQEGALQPRAAISFDAGEGRREGRSGVCGRCGKGRAAPLHAWPLSPPLPLSADPPAGQAEWKATEGGFTCALDLVRHIKAEYGETFCISVAGYPEGHPTVIKKVRCDAVMPRAVRWGGASTVDAREGALAPKALHPHPPHSRLLRSRRAACSVSARRAAS